MLSTEGGHEIIDLRGTARPKTLKISSMHNTMYFTTKSLQIQTKFITELFELRSLLARFGIFFTKQMDDNK